MSPTCVERGSNINVLCVCYFVVVVVDILLGILALFRNWTRIWLNASTSGKRLQ